MLCPLMLCVEYFIKVATVLPTQDKKKDLYFLHASSLNQCNFILK
jgi:hypothetical protein